MFFLKLVFISAILVFSNLVAAQTPIQTFADFLSHIKTLALEQGIAETTVDNAFADITINEKILALDNKQLEFSLSFGNYLATRLSDAKINKAKEHYQQHRQLLKNISDKYGVAQHILVAFWCLESNFGDNVGDFNVIEALATLAFNSRRKAFFTKELLSALKLLEQQKIPYQAKSSWAGAMGFMQFMPSNIARFGIDANANGLNLWGDLDDVFASAANFLINIGWYQGEKWGREVILPKNFDYAKASLDNQQLLSYWHKQGVRTTSGEHLPNSKLFAAIILPSGHKGPAFLVYRNFDAILNWNRSIFYALSVGLLAQEIAYNLDLKQKAPLERSPNKAEIKFAQKKLIELGYLHDKVDGIIGTKTRAALRKFQTLIQVPADGYLNAEMLDLLKF